jgi:hypothetical protein
MIFEHCQIEARLRGNIDYLSAPSGEEGHGHWLDAVIQDSNGRKRAACLTNFNTLDLSNAWMMDAKCNQADDDAQTFFHVRTRPSWWPRHSKALTKASLEA